MGILGLWWGWDGTVLFFSILVLRFWVLGLKVGLIFGFRRGVLMAPWGEGWLLIRWRLLTW